MEAGLGMRWMLCHLALATHHRLILLCHPVTWALRPLPGALAQRTAGQAHARVMAWPVGAAGRRGSGGAGLRAGTVREARPPSLAPAATPRSRPPPGSASPLGSAPSPPGGPPPPYSSELRDTNFCPGFPALPASSHLHPRRHSQLASAGPIRWPSSLPAQPHLPFLSPES
uniref:Uncharacterized protein n=1 Tax=Rangifer tarandus platyrhynchus TaxID=3082113 RepID=A0ACB0E8Z7_RANTA|nr:unnamed protein product [Rangifer tarandus platyrhynchus]